MCANICSTLNNFVNIDAQTFLHNFVNNYANNCPFSIIFIQNKTLILNVKVYELAKIFSKVDYDMKTNILRKNSKNQNYQKKLSFPH